MEHHHLKEFTKTLERISKIDEVKRIIPWRITRKQQGTSNQHISFSYTTHAWLKLHMKKGWTAQEIFIVCKKEHTQILIKKLQEQAII
jgi:hypothetical protein